MISMEEREVGEGSVGYVGVLVEVARERTHMSEQMGGAPHDDTLSRNDWAEAMRDKLAYLQSFSTSYTMDRQLMLQIAALAIAGVEALDRQGGAYKKIV